jgi:hypothetical protein
MREILMASPARADIPWLLGLLHVVAALSPLLAFDIATCLGAVAVTTLASFVVYVPLTALRLNGGRPIPENTTAPELTPIAHAVLLVLWTTTVWATALLIGLRG